MLFAIFNWVFCRYFFPFDGITQTSRLKENLQKPSSYYIHLEIGGVCKWIWSGVI